jgi:malate dehydrogenase
MAKISVIGAGNVGATCANVLAFNKIASEIVMLDVKEGIAEGKAIDMLQSVQTLGFETKITGVTGDYSQIADSEVVIITSGIPRKPGMSREELIGTNANIVKSVIATCVCYAPKAVFLILSNPMDSMTYLALKSTGLPKNRIFGVGGVLDSSRFKYYLSQALCVDPAQVDGMVIGGHGDTTMIPLKRLATYNGIPVTKLLSAEALDKAAADTMIGGAILTRLLGISSWYAPGAAGAYVAQSIVNDYKRLIPSCVLLEGEYGQNDICIGVPAIIGRNGVEKIITLDLNDEEKALFEESASAVRATNQILKEIDAL